MKDLDFGKFVLEHTTDIIKLYTSSRNVNADVIRYKEFFEGVMKLRAQSFKRLREKFLTEYFAKRNSLVK